VPEILLWIIGVGLGISLLYLAIISLVVGISVRPPRVFQFISPGQLGVKQEEVHLQTEDGLKIGGWWCEAGDEVVIVACHGYLVNRCEFVPYSLAWHKEGYSCLFIDFRGHGRSQGATVTIGHNEARDVAVAVAEAKRRKPHAKIILIGSSMGAAASSFYAAQHPGVISGLFLDGPYSRLDHALHGWWTFIAGQWLSVIMAPSVFLARFFLKVDPKKVSPSANLRKYDGPVLLTYGDRDELCPPHLVAEMEQAAGPNVHLEWFKDCGHGGGRYRDPERFLRLTLEFFDSVRRGDR
jgi:pimeloyl-ACP methyl ester carboxylesterase